MQGDAEYSARKARAKNFTAMPIFMGMAGHEKLLILSDLISTYSVIVYLINSTAFL